MPKAVDRNPQARGLGQSIWNPLRSGISSWSDPLSAIDDTVGQAGSGIRGVIDSAIDITTDTLFELTGIDLSGPAALLEQLLALPLGVLDATPLGSALDVLGQFFPFLPGADSGAFDPTSAASGWIGSTLAPTGLLPMLSGGLLSGSVIPGLDASKIVSGLFSIGQVDGLTDIFSGLDLSADNPIVSAIDSAIADVPGAQELVDTICNALGVPGTGHSAADVLTALQNIPGLNIVSLLSGAVIPLLDASKISSGVFGTGLIPGLDASKIITGVFGTGFIPSLPASQITSGTFLSALIPGLDGSKITSGTVDLGFLPSSLLTNASSIAASLISGVLDAARIPALDASKIGSGVFGTSLIPGLDVSKIVSGVFGAGFIPGLDGSKITSGTVGHGFLPADLLTTASSILASAISGVLSAGNIPGLDASKITSGTMAQSFVANLTTDLAAKLTSSSPLDAANLFGLVASLIPALDASKITSGTLGVGLIPSLAASIITSGTFGTSLIPDLDAGKITTGTLLSALIPSLDGSKIGSGTVGLSFLPASLLTTASSIAASAISGVLGAGNIPALDASKITSGTFAESVTGLTNVWSTFTSAFGGSGSTQAAAQSAATSLETRVSTLEGGGVLTQYTTSATWNKPTNGTDGQPFTADELFTIICICGGDSGSRPSGTVTDTAKGGVGGGYVARRVRYADLAASYAMTIGAAGAAKTTAGVGNAGGVTSFGSLVVGVKGLGAEYREDGSYAVAIPPGAGGEGSAVLASPAGAGGASTAGGSGPFAAGGAAGLGAVGGNGAAAPAGVPSGGGGGAGGSTGATSAFAGGTGGFPGGAGGGGAQNQGAFANGGAGAAGCIYVIAPH